MKRCNTCGVERPLTDFPPDTQNRDRRKGKCRPCVLERQRELRAAHPEKERAWVQENHEKVLDQKRAYRRRNADRLRSDGRVRAQRNRDADDGARSREIAKRHYENNKPEVLARDAERRRLEPEKVRAREMVANEIRRGRMTRPTSCDACGDDRRKVHAHHEDYSKPLDVEWLCARCHKRHHVHIENGTATVVA